MINWKDYKYEEDEISGCYCGECLNECNEDDETCPDCGGEVILDWSHEGFECEKCGNPFECGEGAYVNIYNHDRYLCQDCYNELKD